MIKKINPKIIVYDTEIQCLCTRPFYKHPRGCPNYNKKDGCPPNQLLINNVLDFEKDLYVIYTEFPVEKFAKRMKKRHLKWSQRQIYNPRLWQSHARKLQRIEEVKVMKENGLTKIILSPEAHGVNVTELMKNIGISLKWEWPPEHMLKNKAYLNNTVYIVSLGGHEFNAQI